MFTSIYATVPKPTVLSARIIRNSHTNNQITLRLFNKQRGSKPISRLVPVTYATRREVTSH